METERKRAVIISVIYYLMWAGLLIVLLRHVIPKLTPFVLGFVVAYVLRKPTRSVCQRANLPHKPVALLIVLLFYATAGLLLALSLVKVFYSVCSLVEMLPHLYETHMVPAIGEIFLRIESVVYRMDASLFSLIREFDDQLLASLGKMISGVSGWAVSAASNVATSIPALFIKLVLMIISTFFIAADYDRLVGFCMRQLGTRSREIATQVKAYLIGTLFVCIRSYLIIMSLTFVELSVGLTILGLKHAVLVAGLVAVFDILPVLGTGGIMVPWAVIALLQGDSSMALALLLLYVAITVIRNIVEPKIVGSQLGLHPVVTLSSMFAGVQMFGVVGLFGFPIVLSLLRYLNENGTIHLFKLAQEEETSGTVR